MTDTATKPTTRGWYVVDDAGYGGIYAKLCDVKPPNAKAGPYEFVTMATLAAIEFEAGVTE